MMLVSIITVVFNREKTIAKTIESVLDQTYPNIEYLIIDGKSQDRTLEVARSYQTKFDKRRGRLLSIISESDKGMYDALNKGAQLVHGEIVGQINADDWYEPNAVAVMANAYLKKNYDLAWGNIRIFRPSGQMVKKAKEGRLWTTLGWCHPAAFSKRETLLACPYVLESMYDDFDYVTNVYKKGKKIVIVNRLIANFTFGGMSTQKQMNEVRKRIGYRYHIYRKYGYSRLYLIHCLAIELAKYLLG